jgi:hypothetical protein
MGVVSGTSVFLVQDIIKDEIPTKRIDTCRIVKNFFMLVAFIL